MVFRTIDSRCEKLILRMKKKELTDDSSTCRQPHSRTDIRGADESAALHNSSTGHSSSRPVGRKQTLNAWWGQKDSSRTRS